MSFKRFIAVSCLFALFSFPAMGASQYFVPYFSGSVGIGTSAPATFPNWTPDPDSRVLTITGSGNASANSYGVLNMSNNRATATVGDILGGFSFGHFHNSGGNMGALIGSYLEGGGGTNGFGANLSFWTKNDNALTHTEKMRITNDGNVGIGLTTPTSRLHVYEARTDTAAGGVATQSTVQVINPASASASTFYASRSIGQTSAANSQTVGTGVGSLGQFIHYGSGTLSASIGAQASTVNAGSGTMTNSFGAYSGVSNSSAGNIVGAYGIQALTSNTGAGTINNAFAGSFSVQTTAGATTNGYGVYIGSIAATNKWGLYQSDATAKNYFAGNVGIGTTNPSYPIDVFNSSGGSQMHLGGTATQGIYLSGYDAPYGAMIGGQVDGNWIAKASGASAIGLLPGGINFYTATGLTVGGTMSSTASLRMTLSTAGNLGIGTTAPAYKLHVVGTAGLSTGTAWTNASDVRLKDIHGDYEYGLNEILKLHTVRFSYKKGNALGLPSDHPMTGFVAQEVQKVIPDAVHEGKNGYLDLNADPIHWAVVNAIQDLYRMVSSKLSRHSTEIEALKTELREKDRRIDSLEARLSRLESR